MKLNKKMLMTVKDHSLDDYQFLRKDKERIMRGNTSLQQSCRESLRQGARLVKKFFERLLCREDTLDPNHGLLSVFSFLMLLLSYALIFCQSIKLAYQEDLYAKYVEIQNLKIISKYLRRPPLFPRITILPGVDSEPPRPS